MASFSRIFSWDGIDRTLSSKAQTVFIIAALFANLLFLNEQLRNLLKTFVDEPKGPSACTLFVDPIDKKLVYIYISAFLLGIAATLAKAFMPRILKEYRGADAYVSAHRTAGLAKVLSHYKSFVVDVPASRRKRRLYESLKALVEDNREIGLSDPGDIQAFSEKYFRLHYELAELSTIAAPAAKLTLALSVLIFFYQASKTFVAVLCLEFVAR